MMYPKVRDESSQIFFPSRVGFFGFLIVMCEPQVFGLRADSSLAFFEISGFGRVRVVQNLLRTGGQAGIYVHTRT